MIAKRILFTLFLCSVTFLSMAQDHAPSKGSPTLVESLVGDRGTYIQMMMDKKFKSSERFGFFSVNSIVAEWDTKEVEDMMLQSYLTYEFYKGFKLNAGFHYAKQNGIRPTAGILYTHVNSLWTVVLFPRVDLGSKPNMELFGLLEYKPKITEKLNFYSRFQANYVHNPSMDAHQKSAWYVRAGLKYKEFTFGAGFNADYYGPHKRNINNIGGFLGVALF